MRRHWLILATLATLAGCASEPEKPIVLRRPYHPPRVVRKPAPAKEVSAPAAAPDAGVPLTPAEKEELFRAFDDYLAKQPGPLP